ncbi:MAG: hypothetical protein K8W52_43660 [Deltaproteobacteria bacterium]|nr:hypothetical protein [Deltaproteobacteria bacterium]
MFLKERRPSTDPRLRSLLQKAARRGYLDVVEGTARRLDAIGDRAWLRSRAAVITFEECWPLAETLALTKDVETKIRPLLQVTAAAKQKDAAGLGALAFAFHEGDNSMLALVPNDWPIRVVSEGLNRPGPFFAWALTQCTSDHPARIVDVARQYLAAATWGWDKTCILAGAFLAATESSIPVCPPSPTPDGSFPYWIALDKHTPQGKEALRTLGAELKLQYRHLIWAGFYFESARVNRLLPSRWWVTERNWRLRQVGLTAESAVDIWDSVKALLADRLTEEADELALSIEARTAGQQGLF